MHDVIVVGGRCAGAPVAMLLARLGYRVLLVDRAKFPSDTVAGGGLQPSASAYLHRWGILDRLLATGCPPLAPTTFDAGEVAFTGTPPPVDGIDYTLLVRRNVLDSLLVDAAIDAGVEVREGFHVVALSSAGERIRGVVGRTAAGTLVAERASVVIGADGWQSIVAREVGAPAYHEQPSLSVNAYSYWSNLPVEGLGLHARPGRFVIAGRSHDGLTLLQAVIARQDEAAFRLDIERAFADTIRSIDALADGFAGATREERFRFVTSLPNGFRKPWGAGWALVGDAGYVKDPVTAQGMGDAFRDAELVAEAVDAALSGRQSERDAFAAYERRRNEAALPMYELTCRLARVDEPPPAHLLEVMGEAAGNQEKADRFLGVIAGTVPVDDVLPVGQFPDSPYRARSAQR